MKHLLAVSLTLVLPAAADEVVLRNGARFSGVVTRANGRVHVRMDVGEMSFAAVDVASVHFGETAGTPRVERAAENEASPPRASNMVVDRLEAEARQRELERLRASEESRLDALLSLEIDRLNLERERRLGACRARPHKRFKWPVWGD